MTFFQAIVLGVVQGLTEFLPVSSSGHLVLVEEFLGLESQHLLSFDVLVHAGTLLALCIVFRTSLWQMLCSLPGMWNKQVRQTEGFKLLSYLCLATLPVVVVAPFLKPWLENQFRGNSTVIGFLGLTAFLLALSEVLGKQNQARLNSLHPVLSMGFFQILALFPGVSRSGSTLVGGLLSGLTRYAAAEFAFLMAIPAIAGALVFTAKDLIETSQVLASPWVLLAGFFASAISSWMSARFMLDFVQRRGLWVFVIYLLILQLCWWGPALF